VVAVAAAVAGAAEAAAVAEAAVVAVDVAAVAVCPGVLAASADQISYRLHCKTKVIMAGLDNIDPAVLCLDGGAARACKRARA
jgi:hypothetical protein